MNLKCLLFSKLICLIHGINRVHIYLFICYIKFQILGSITNGGDESCDLDNVSINGGAIPDRPVAKKIHKNNKPMHFENALEMTSK